jgi:hypothetical protein
MLAGGGHHELAGEHEHFLRCESDILSRIDRGEGGLESGRANDCDENEIGFGERGDFDQARKTAVKTGADGKGRRGSFGGGVSAIVENRDVRHAEVARDAGETFVIVAGGDADELKLVGMRGDDAERVFADRTGGAEQDDAFRCGGG